MIQKPTKPERETFKYFDRYVADAQDILDLIEELKPKGIGSEDIELESEDYGGTGVRAVWREKIALSDIEYEVKCKSYEILMKLYKEELQKLLDMVGKDE